MNIYEITSNVSRLNKQDEIAMEDGKSILSFYDFLTKEEQQMLAKWEVNGFLNRRGVYHPKTEEKASEHKDDNKKST